MLSPSSTEWEMTWFTEQVLVHLGCEALAGLPQQFPRATNSWDQLVIYFSEKAKVWVREPQDQSAPIKGLIPEDPWGRCQLGSDRSHVYIVQTSQLLHMTLCCHPGVCCANPHLMTIGMFPYVLTDACIEPKATMIVPLQVSGLQRLEASYLYNLVQPYCPQRNLGCNLLT